MGTSRLDVLRGMLERDPNDSFARYGLAMETRNQGDLEGALHEFRTLLAADPAYVPAYFHTGQTLERLGRLEEAGQVYREGIEAATAKGDQHARSELQFALDSL